MAVNKQPRWAEIWVREEEGQRMTSKTGQIQWKGTQIWPQVTPSKTSACRQRMSVKKMTNKKNDVHGSVKNSECSWFECADTNPTLKLKIIRNAWRKSKDAFWNSQHNVFVRGQDLRGRAESRERRGSSWRHQRGEWWRRGGRCRYSGMKRELWRCDSANIATWDCGSGSNHKIAQGRRGVTVVSCPAQVTHTLQLITAHLQHEEENRQWKTIYFVTIKLKNKI